MTLDITDFWKRLETEDLPEPERANLIYAEIRKAEQLKISLTDEIDQHPEYIVEVSDKIDTYVFRLQELMKKIVLAHLPLDQQTALSDEEVRQQIGERINILKQFGK